MANDNGTKGSSRRTFLRNTGRAACACALGGVGYRIFRRSGKKDATEAPTSRYVWQINERKCTFCGLCQTACVRKPSAVKAVNDQKKCSFCVICYGHIADKSIDSDKVMSHGKRICPIDAVNRKNYSGGIDGTFIYDIDHNLCDGCGKCARECNRYGTKSMFLIIRPDLCLNCNRCSIAAACPENAIDRLHPGAEDDYRGEFGLYSEMGGFMDGGMGEYTEEDMMPEGEE